MDISSQAQIEDALKGLTVDYFYSGNLVGHGDKIELDVCSIIMDAEENIYLRSCHYSGQKHTWKEFIKEQLKRHLRDVGVEAGIVTSETRYFEVTPEEHFQKEQGLKISEITSKIEKN